MKLDMQQRTNVTSGSLKRTKVEFEANAVSFYAQVTGLAKDKIRYPMREISSNAWDECKGNFEVHLPTELNPIFRVRDYGPGMSDDTMQQVYGKLYASTKRTDNGKVGGWGLGSKSPFSYLITDNGAGTYNVTSYHDGWMRSYVMSLSDEGELIMDTMIEMPTTEPSGLEVSFAVRREDIYDFHQAARDVLWGFNPRPTIFPAIEWDEPIIQSQGEYWTTYKHSSVPFYGPHVRMGCAIYPFDLSQIRSSGFLSENDCVLFEAPIGSLKVTLSREQIAYSDGTKATLTELVQAYESAFITQLQDKVDASENLFAANQACHDMCVGLGETREARMRNAVTWRGHRLSTTLSVPGAKLCTLPDGWHHFDKFEGGSVRSSWPRDAKIVMEHTPRYSLSRFAMANLVGEKILWVRCKRADRATVLHHLGNPEVIDLDAFKVPVEKVLGKLVRKRKTIEILEEGQLRSTTQHVDLADGGYFVEQAPAPYSRRRRGEYFRLTPHGTGVRLYDMDTLIKLCVKFGFIDPGTTVLVKQPGQEVPDNWTMLGPELIDQLKDKVDLTEQTGLKDKTLSNLDYRLKGIAKLAVWERAPEDLKEFKADLDALIEVLKQNKVEETDSDKAIDALASLGVHTDTPAVVCPIRVIDQKWTDICDEYPLMRNIIGGLSQYGDNVNVRDNLNHYFELLCRPPLVDEPASSEHIELDQAA